MCAEGYSERLYPIGALSEKEAVGIRLDSLCSDSVGIDELLEDWREVFPIQGSASSSA